MFVRIDSLAPRHTSEVWSHCTWYFDKTVIELQVFKNFTVKIRQNPLTRLSSLQGAVMCLCFVCCISGQGTRCDEKQRYIKCRVRMIFFYINNYVNLRSCAANVDSTKSFICQLMHKNYYKIVKELKSFKFIIDAATCFDLHKPSSGRSQPVLR